MVQAVRRTYEPSVWVPGNTACLKDAEITSSLLATGNYGTGKEEQAAQRPQDTSPTENPSLVSGDVVHCYSAGSYCLIHMKTGVVSFAVVRIPYG